MQHTLFVSTINKKVILRIFLLTYIQRVKIKEIVYFHPFKEFYFSKLLFKHFKVKQVTFTDNPKAYVDNDKRINKIIEAIFRHKKLKNSILKLLKEINENNHQLLISVKKILVSLLRDDVILLSIAAFYNKKGRNLFLCKEYGLMKIFESKKIKRIEFFEITKKIEVMRKIFLLKLVLINILRLKEKNGNINIKTNVEYIIELLYTSSSSGNREFDAFYNYFKNKKNILYICPIAERAEDESYYKILNKNNETVYSKENIAINSHISRDDIKKYIKYLFFLLINQSIHSINMKNYMVDIVNHFIYYERLFNTYKPKYYLKIRYDYEYAHVITTIAAEKLNVKHIGYQCGSYPNHSPLLTHIDFHYYGVLGECFYKEILKEYWLKTNVKYKLLGPFVGESYKEQAIESERENFIITLFPTSFSYNLYMNEEFYDFFIDICCMGIKSLPKEKILVIIKDKTYNSKREEKTKEIIKKYSLDMKFIYNNDIYDTGCEVASSYKLIENSDLSIIMSFSTVGWDIISRLKKCLIVEQEWNVHPFEKHLSQLVVRNIKEMNESLFWLIGHSQEHYEKEIKALIECCSKKADGNLVKEFFESIENDNSNNIDSTY